MNAAQMEQKSYEMPPREGISIRGLAQAKNPTRRLDSQGCPVQAWCPVPQVRAPFHNARHFHLYVFGR